MEFPSQVVQAHILQLAENGQMEVRRSDEGGVFLVVAFVGHATKLAVVPGGDPEAVEVPWKQSRNKRANRSDNVTTMTYPSDL